MATSPNYAWAEPDNSSLVKNGASDIRTLGDAIDTSVWNSGFGQAGKNKLINGDFTINQRAFTSTTTTATFGFDRWNLSATDGTTTYSAQTFTLGAAPVASYEATNYARLVSTGQTATNALSALNQPIENVRTFAGQTITVSFWAKAASGTPNITVFGLQNFGGSGSSPVFIAANNKQAISTSWARYSFQLSIPSIAGKTIAGGGDLLRLYITTSAGSDRNSYTNSLGIQSATIDIWGGQAEYGSKATPFQTASGGSLQAELAMCQRYYYRANVSAIGNRFGNSMNFSTTEATVLTFFPSTMRTNPTALETSGTAADYSVTQAVTNTACSVVPAFATANPNNATSTFTVAAGLTLGAASFGRAAATNAYLGWSAEL